jgi:hypothetical protein
MLTLLCFVSLSCDDKDSSEADSNSVNLNDTIKQGNPTVSVDLDSALSPYSIDPNVVIDFNDVDPNNFIETKLIKRAGPTGPLDYEED